MKFKFSRSKKIAKNDYSQIVKDSPRNKFFFNRDDNKCLLFICSHVIGILTERI